jgi:hypothetical protein
MFDKNSVFKSVAVLSALGFVAFSFLFPEANNSAMKANFCLLIGLGSLAIYFYTKGTNEVDFNERDSIYRHIDSVTDGLQRQIDEVHRELDCCKKQKNK